MDPDSTAYSERRLWAKMMLRFLLDLGNPEESMGAARQRQRDHALAWFESSSMTIGSFRWICQELDLNSTRILRLVREGTFRVFCNLENLVDRLEQHMAAQERLANKSIIAEESGIPRSTVSNLIARKQEKSRYAPALGRYLEQVEASG